MLALVAFLTLVALAIPVEHLAFSRHPRLIDNEVARRAVGIGTVMLLGLIPVAFGGLDWRTWATLLAGFLLAGGGLGGAGRLERVAGGGTGGGGRPGWRVLSSVHGRRAARGASNPRVWSV